MTVQLELNGEIEAFAKTLAERDGVTVDVLLSRAVQELLAEEQREDALLSVRLEEADRGEFLSEEEMDARFQKMLQPR
jgi:predicted transcriptional regulator